MKPIERSSESAARWGDDLVELHRPKSQGLRLFKAMLDENAAESSTSECLGDYKSRCRNMRTAALGCLLPLVRDGCDASSREDMHMGRQILA